MKISSFAGRGFVVLSALWAATASADMVTLTPSSHNTLVQVPSTSSQQLANGLGDLFVGRTNQDGQGPATISTRRGLISFDVAGNIPVGSIITGVTLTMWDVMGLNGPQEVDLHKALASWGQGTSFFNGGVGGPATQNDATWFDRFYNATNPNLSTPWAAAGGDFSTTVSGSAIIANHTSGVNQAFSWLGSSSPLMIADVQFWLDQPSNNFGWLLEGNEAHGQTAKRFSGSTTAPTFLPTLSITFTSVPEPNSTLLLGSGIALVWGATRRRRRLHPGADA
jgi:PEP-CTERM motif